MKPEHIEQIKALVEAVEALQCEGELALAKAPVLGPRMQVVIAAHAALPALKAAIAEERILEESDLRKG